MSSQKLSCVSQSLDTSVALEGEHPPVPPPPFPGRMIRQLLYLQAGEIVTSVSV